MKKYSLYGFISSIILGISLLACTKKETIQFNSDALNIPGQKPGSNPPANPAIAYINNNNLMVMNADGSNQTVIVAGSSGAPSWAPSGTSIVFAGTINSVNGIWIVDVSIVNGVPKGSNLHNIPMTFANNPSSATWSPNGDLILFTATAPDFDINIYTIPPTGGTPTIVYTSPSGLFPRQPDWNPDGSKIVFSEGTEGSPHLFNLQVLDLNTAQLTTVVPLSTFYIKYPSWSRNGDRIALDGNDTNTESIYTVIPTTNATLVKIIDGAFPAWSPNDSKLVFTGSRPSGVYSYTFSTNTRQKLSDGSLADWKK